jgi:hypothetical protein
MNPFKALTDRFRALPAPVDQSNVAKTDWDRFVDETIAGEDNALVIDGMLSTSKSGDEVYRFACPACERGLRLPSAAISKRFVCSFCRSVYKFDLAKCVSDVAAPPNSTALSRWNPLTGVAASISTGLRAEARLKSAKAAILSTASAATNFVRPIAGLAAGAASVVLPGTGEVLAGNRKWGFCTMAAFFGATAAASAAGGVWIALPIAIRVISAHQAVSKSDAAAEETKRQLAINAQEAQEVAEQLARDAQRLDDEAFEREMRDRELAELQAATGSEFVKLKLIPVR